MTLYANNSQIICCVPCPKYKVESGQCSCIPVQSRLSEKEEKKEEIEIIHGKNCYTLGTHNCPIQQVSPEVNKNKGTQNQYDTDPYEQLFEFLQSVNMHTSLHFPFDKIESKFTIIKK